MIVCEMSALTNWIQAIATLAIVLLTLLTLIVLTRYAADTKRIAEVSASQTENSQMPCLVVVQIYGEGHRILGWGIENQGAGPALNVRFTGYGGGNEPAIKPTAPIAANAHRLLHNDIEEVFRRWPRDFKIDYESLSGARYATTISMENDLIQTRFYKPPAPATDTTIREFLKTFKEFKTFGW